MNERIKELAVEAGIISAEYNGFDPTGLTKAQRKFAELIVQECMACSTWVGKMNNNTIEPVHTAHAINQRIRKHFGVEE